MCIRDRYGTASAAQGCHTQPSDREDHSAWIECGIRSLRSRYRTALPFPFSEKHRLRSTFLFHVEHEQFCWLGITGIATHGMYIRWRFGKDLTGVNCLWAFTFHLSNESSLEHVHKHVRVMSMRLRDFPGSKVDGFDHAFLAWHVTQLLSHQSFRFSGLGMRVAEHRYAANNYHDANCQ